MCHGIPVWSLTCDSFFYHITSWFGIRQAVNATIKSAERNCLAMPIRIGDRIPSCKLIILRFSAHFFYDHKSLRFIDQFVPFDCQFYDSRTFRSCCPVFLNGYINCPDLRVREFYCIILHFCQRISIRSEYIQYYIVAVFHNSSLVHPWSDLIDTCIPDIAVRSIRFFHIKRGGCRIEYKLTEIDISAAI